MKKPIRIKGAIAKESEERLVKVEVKHRHDLEVLAEAFDYIAIMEDDHRDFVVDGIRMVLFFVGKKSWR